LGFYVPESFSNFVLAKCNGCRAEDIYNKLVKRNIYVRFFKLAGIDDKLRISVGTPQENDKLLAALKEILQ
jgi:histidinol-phosphate aminotransferase